MERGNEFVVFFKVAAMKYEYLIKVVFKELCFLNSKVNRLNGWREILKRYKIDIKLLTS